MYQLVLREMLGRASCPGFADMDQREANIGKQFVLMAQKHQLKKLWHAESWIPVEPNVLKASVIITAGTSASIPTR